MKCMYWSIGYCHIQRCNKGKQTTNEGLLFSEEKYEILLKVNIIFDIYLAKNKLHANYSESNQLRVERT